MLKKVAIDLRISSKNAMREGVAHNFEDFAYSGNAYNSK
jgi:hypothetical protein